MFFLESLFLGPTDSGGWGGDRKHIPQCAFNIHSLQPQTCLGEPGKAFLVTIVFAKVQKTKIKKKKTIKIFFFKKRNKDSSPGLYFRFEVGGNSMCLGLAMGPQSLAIIPSVAVWQVFVGCGFWPPREMNGTGEGLCHAPHTSGPSWGVAGPSGQASGPGSTCLSSAGQMLSLLVCSCLQIPP